MQAGRASYRNQKVRLRASSLAGLHRWAEKSEAIPSSALGPVHRDIGAPYDLVWREVRAYEHRDADARRRSESPIRDPARLVEAAQDAGRDLAAGALRRTARPTEVLREHDELVAPKRATASPERSLALSRAAISMSSRSPAWWPRLSFSILKLSRSMKSIAPCEPLRALSASASSILSSSRRRFERLVRGSRKASS